MRIKVINGPNMNLLGLRQPEVYGRDSYEGLVQRMQDWAEHKKITLECLQSNHEGEIIDWIQATYSDSDAILINPAAYTHTSIAIRDALLAVQVPTVEVHISEISQREAFRQHSFISDIVLATVQGKGIAGYLEGLEILYQHLVSVKGQN